MKLQFKLLAVLLLVAGISTATMAQNSDEQEPKKKETAVKILPSGDAGLLKLLYVNAGEKKVEVKMYDENGLLFKEDVRGNRFKGTDGFIKFYNISELKPGTYWLEVTDSQRSVKHEMSMTEDGTMWVNYWDNFMPVNQVVALEK